MLVRFFGESMSADHHIRRINDVLITQKSRETLQKKGSNMCPPTIAERERERE